ncbi:MAG: chromate efflux transporter [Marinobacter sp.]|uniref:chromate efflux transporter n=1 Tax=Marinobacter sp. TaxID=50741 RepID=UPI00349FF964
MASTRDEDRPTLPELFLIFLRLGLTSFGGPAAHLGFFHDEFVRRRRWLSDAAYGEIVALCQLLPGPASSQVGLAVGFLQRGYRGAALAWLAFTLPSAFLMGLFAAGLSVWPEAGNGGWVEGLKLFVVAVVAQAVWQMGKTLCPDAPRLTIALAVAAVLLLVGSVWVQVLALIAAGIVGLGLKNDIGADKGALSMPLEGRRPLAFALAFLLLLAASFLPFASGSLAWIGAELYRSGALVFGGGHVVLPWLESSFVASGAMPPDTFLAGYGVVQAMPGPLFSFSAFLGTAEAGFFGGLLAVVAVFLPGTLLVFAGLPLWTYVRQHPGARYFLAGVSAGVVGLLLSALYDPVWISAVKSPEALALVLVIWTALALWRVPVWLMAPACAVVGAWLL